MSAPIRVEIDTAEELYLVEGDTGAFFVATSPNDPFTPDDPGGAFVCVAQSPTVDFDLRQLGAAVATALRELGARRRDGAS